MIYKKINNKKGLGTVIATVLLIVFSLTAVATLGIIIQKTVNNLLASPEFTCLDFQTNPAINIKTVCYDEESKDLIVNLERKISNLEIISLEIVTNSEQFFCGSSCGNCEILNQGLNKNYYFNTQKAPDKISLKVNNCFINERKNIPLC
ncbi:MAG: hypothetical protein ACE5ES_03110 [Candidatus Nanoarchaeia archaeon]